MSESSSVSVWSVVPSIYYDLIARIAPGSAFVLSVDTARAQILDVHSDMLKILLTLGCGYIAGLLLTSCYELIIGPGWLLSLLPKVRGWLGLQANVEMPRNANDIVGSLFPELGATLAKMQAESVLCANLATGFLVLWILPLDSYVAKLAVLPEHRWNLSLFVFLVVVANYRYFLWRGRQIAAYMLRGDSD